MKRRTYEAVFTIAFVATVLAITWALVLSRIDWAALAALSP